VIVPDLRGFGASDQRAGEPAEAYAGAGQAASVLGLLRELGLPAAVIAGYDIGSRIAQQMARVAPAAVRAYLEHFWQHWSGPGYTPDPAQLDRLAAAYGTSGAFTASIGWYRAGSGTVAGSLAEQTPAPEDRIAVPTTVLWPGHDPLFPRDWSDRIEAFFSAATVKSLPEAGHFTPLEAPAEFAGAILAALQDG
jgi:pimeloyl-ACP methyl ester carboxylesterase